MADTLSQKLAKSKKRLKVGGQAGLTSEEELQSLAAKQGIAPPTSPAGAGTLGASPDQAKMAGTKMQVGAATGISADLGTAMRRAQTRTGATEEEQAKLEKSQDLAMLGGLGDRVQDLISSYMAPEQEEEVTAGVQVRPESLDSLPAGVDAAQFSQDLAGIASGDMDSAVRVATALGLDYNDPQLAQKLEPYFMGDVEQIGAMIAGATPDTISMSEDLAVQLGYGDIAELESSLSMDPGTTSSLSLAQFQDFVNTQIEAEYNQVESLKRQASNPNISPAERAEARKALREAGAVGIRATEEDMDELQQSVEAADEIEFGGESYKVADLLDDDTMSTLVKGYLENEEIAEQLASTEPEFVKWVEDHRAALETATQELDTSVGEFEAIQEENVALATPMKGVAEFDNEFMSDLMGDEWGQFSASRFEKPEVLKLFEGLEGNQDQAASLKENLSKLHSYGPEVFEELKGLSAQELKSLGIKENSSRFQNYMGFLGTRKLLADMGAKALPELLLGKKGVGFYSLNETFKRNKDLSTFGLPNYHHKYGKLLDTNGDGRVDDPALLHQNMTSRMSKFSIKDAARGRSAPGIPQYKDVKLGDTERKLFSKYRHLAKDGQITLSDINKMKTYDLPDIYKTLTSLDPGVRSMVAGRYAGKVLKFQKKLRSPADGYDNMQHFAITARENPRKVMLARSTSYVQNVYSSVRDSRDKLSRKISDMKAYGMPIDEALRRELNTFDKSLEQMDDYGSRTRTDWAEISK